MAFKSLLSIAPFFASGLTAREITFPPVSGYSAQQVIPQGLFDADITQAKFAGLMTYANLPYVHCLAPEGHDVEPFDIAILGAPFDTDNTVALKQLGKAHEVEAFLITRLIRNTSIHAGIRAPVARPKGDLRNDVRCGFEMIKAREIDRIGVSGVIEKLKSRVGKSKVYISVDIDVLDPAFAPATGTAEVGGWSTRELLSILDGLEGLDVVGADVGISPRSARFSHTRWHTADIGM
ncbi:arginase family protein [Stemphylium lycopersici]|nr:arginase family protein [Stemphylium lycopersici]RAR10452.1 arginase family protein [Stemphylium lycopersici]